MEKKYTASEVRDIAWPHTMDAQVWARKWLEITKDRPELAADEGAMIGWFANAIMAGYDSAMLRSNNAIEHVDRYNGPGRETEARQMLVEGSPSVAHRAPSDAERLAEALHSIGERLSSVLCDPFGEVVVRGSDDDRQIIAQALKDLGELAAHSAQAQPKNVPFVRETWPEDADGDLPDLCTVCGKPVLYGTRHTACAIAQAQPPTASVTVDAVMKVIDGQQRLPYCSIDEKQAFRNKLEAALAAQKNK